MGDLFDQSIYQWDAIFINLLYQWGDNISMGGKFIVGIHPLTLHRQQLYINRSQYCYEIYDWVRIFNGNI
jgi:hypothetical protein